MVVIPVLPGRPPVSKTVELRVEPAIFTVPFEWSNLIPRIASIMPPSTLISPSPADAFTTPPASRNNASRSEVDDAARSLSRNDDRAENAASKKLSMASFE